KVWESETAALVKAIESRYDPKAQPSRHALKLARQMADTSIEQKLPTVANSLQAVQALREANAKSAQNGSIPSTDEAAPAAAPEVVAPDQAPSTPEPEPGLESRPMPESPAPESSPPQSQAPESPGAQTQSSAASHAQS